MPGSLLFVLGTPRSGINTLSQCLKAMGIKALASEGAADATTINQLLLQDLDVSSYSPALPEGWMESGAAGKAKSRIERLVSELLSFKGILQLTSANPLTLKLWQQAFNENKINVRYFLMLRHPWETALSLAANHNLDLQRGHILWLAHTRAVLHQLSSQVTDPTSSSPNNNYQITDNCLITYDQLLADPVSTISNAFDSLLTSLRGVGPSGPEADHRLPRETTPEEFPQGFHWGSLTSDLLDHVQPSLKHHHVSDLPEADREAYRPYARLYDQILSIQHSSSAKISGDLRLKSSSSSLLSEFDLIDSLLKTLAQHDHSTDSSRYNQSGTTDNWLQTTGLYATIIFPSSNTQGEITKTIPLIEDQWQKIELPVPEPGLLRVKPIILKPMNRAGLVSISAVKIIDQSTGEKVWSAQWLGNEATISLEGAVLRMPGRDNNLDLLAAGDKTALVISGSTLHKDCPMQIEIWLKPCCEPDRHYHLLQTFLNLDEWEKILDTRSDFDNVELNLRQGLAEISMKRGEWAEAVRRWQFVIDKHGTDTPEQVYSRLDQAYCNVKAFPRGMPEEEKVKGEMDYLKFLAQIHSQLEPKLYLEIGVQTGKSLTLARCRAIGVDPMPQLKVDLTEQAEVLKMTSDGFFKNAAPGYLKQPPDLVFIDGMHLFEYAMRDFMNVEKYSAPNTLVVMDDIFPNHPAQAERVRTTSAWTGDVWKIYEIFQKYRSDLFLLPVNTHPTGLLLIAGLDKQNSVLWDNYEEIVKEYHSDVRPPEHIIYRYKIFSPVNKSIKDFLNAMSDARKAKLSRTSFMASISMPHMSILESAKNDNNMLYGDSQKLINNLQLSISEKEKALEEKLSIINSLQRTHVLLSNELLNKVSDK
jgi:hypothetical protein